MFRKVMVSPLFKFKIPWMDKFIENFNALGDDWQHYIFTDQNIVSKGNVHVYRMNAESFTDLVEQKTGVRPFVPAPSPKFGDMRPAFGLIFQDWIKEFDFWGHMDFDIVMGDLNKYATDEILSECDIFSTEPREVNGIFSLYRNDEKTKRFFMEYESWPRIFQDEKYHAFDEQAFSRLVMEKWKAGKIRFHGKFYQEHDKQAHHDPTPQLIRHEGRLLNALTGQEMMIFHFRRTKVWPL